MTEYLLILMLSMPGQPAGTIPVGIIFSKSMCDVIGKGVAQGMMDATPGLAAEWECLPQIGDLA